MFEGRRLSTSNLLVNMLESHKPGSTFDFELAVAREWELGSKLNIDLNQRSPSDKGKIVWNFKKEQSSFPLLPIGFVPIFTNFQADSLRS